MKTNGTHRAGTHHTAAVKNRRRKVTPVSEIWGWAWAGTVAMDIRGSRYGSIYPCVLLCSHTVHAWVPLAHDGGRRLRAARRRAWRTYSGGLLPGRVRNRVGVRGSVYRRC